MYFLYKLLEHQKWRLAIAKFSFHDICPAVFFYGDEGAASEAATDAASKLRGSGNEAKRGLSAFDEVAVIGLDGAVAPSSPLLSALTSTVSFGLARAFAAGIEVGDDDDAGAADDDDEEADAGDGVVPDAGSLALIKKAPRAPK